MANSFNKHFKNMATWTLESMTLVAMWTLSPKRKKGWYGLIIIVRSAGGNDDLFFWYEFYPKEGTLTLNQVVIS
jgi:hypothetical protein